MKRILLVLILLLVGGYSVLWFVKKGNVEEAVAAKLPASPIVMDEISFHYAGYEVGGFPFAYTVELKEPRFEMKMLPLDENITVEVACGDNLELRAGLFSSEISAKICDELTTEYKVENAPKSSVLKSDLTLAVGLKEPLWKSLLLGDGLKIDENFDPSDFDFISLHANKMDSYVGDKKVSEIGELDFYFSGDMAAVQLGQPGDVEVRYGFRDMKILDRDLYMESMNIYNGLGTDFASMKELMYLLSEPNVMPSTVMLSAKANLQSGGKASFSIRDITISNDAYALHADGKFSSDNAMMGVPQGKLNVKADNYKTMLDSYYLLYNGFAEIMENPEFSGLPASQGSIMPELPQAVVPAFASFLEQIADVDGNDLSFVIEVGEDGQPKFGKLGVMEAMMALSQTMGPAMQPAVQEPVVPEGGFVEESPLEPAPAPTTQETE